MRAHSLLLLSTVLGVSSQQVFTEADVRSHNVRADCWVILQGSVYDLTKWAPMHPGGTQAIYNQCGRDGTVPFQSIAKHLNKNVLAIVGPKYRLGSYSASVSAPVVAPLLSAPVLNARATSTPSKPAQTGFTFAEVSSHNARTDCWVILQGGVYDLTKWALKHPGGKQNIYNQCGLDGTAAFQKVREHTSENVIASIGPQYRIGSLLGAQDSTVKKQVVAYDFDGTLQTGGDATGLGEPIPQAIKQLKKDIKRGYRVTINTGRPASDNKMIMSFLKQNGIVSKHVSKIYNGQNKYAGLAQENAVAFYDDNRNDLDKAKRLVPGIKLFLVESSVITPIN